MKTARRKLFETLQDKKIISSEEPLSNVKKGLGSLGYLQGNPLTKTEILINIRLIFYDLATGLDIAPAAVPAAFQTQIPVYLFGLTDFFGGYNRMQTLVPAIPQWVNPPFPWLGAFPYGIYEVTGADGGSLNIRATAQPGDMLQFYGDITPLSNLGAAIVIHCENVAYGTLLNSFVSENIVLDRIRYITPAANPTQLDNPITLATQSIFGKTFSDKIDPRMFTFNSSPQANLVDIPLNSPITKDVMMGFYMNFDCPNVSFVMFVKKVENLIKG